jgi:hypothetical protein
MRTLNYHRNKGIKTVFVFRIKCSTTSTIFPLGVVAVSVCTTNHKGYYLSRMDTGSVSHVSQEEREVLDAPEYSAPQD